jgi:leucyl aminopeptidase
MDYSLKTAEIAKMKTACLVLGVYAQRQLTPAAEEVDRASKGALGKILKQGDMTGEAGQQLMLYEVPGVAAARVLLVGLDKTRDYKLKTWCSAISGAVKYLHKSHPIEAVFCLPEPSNSDIYQSLRQAVIVAEEAVYLFDQTKSEVKKRSRPLKNLAFVLSDKGNRRSAQKALNHGRAIAQGMNLAKELANLPGNICTPSYLANQAKKLGTQSDKLKIQVLEERQMEKLGMGALLSVSRGSRQPAKLIIMKYSGGKPNAKPILLVGKGLTFDAGGISLKPAAAMDEMKYDMCGGASVFGAIKVCAELELPLNVIGVVPASENLPDGDANKPGDIVTSMSGQTIEVLNTDAEGRLILCDALTYSERFKPAAVIDIATLTGACIVALGNQASGLMANSDELAEEVLEAGQRSSDRAWRLPLWDEFQEQLKSNFADMANIGGKGAGTITAACFLSRYTKKFKWAHLDIAGTAWLTGGDKGATGRPVPLLSHFLIKRAGQGE